jgi:probable HAF family extracellular repeat protein
MRFSKVVLVIAIASLAALGDSILMKAQAQRPEPPKARYTIKDLGTLGGSFSQAGGISDAGWVEGFSLVAGDAAFHVFLWHDGVMTDVGTLGGPNSFSEFRPNNQGDAGGYSETLAPDPNGEDFCGFGDYLVCLPFFWSHGRLIAQPTLGGPNGAGFGTNDLGELAGTAENTIPDPGCAGTGQVLQYKPVVWSGGRVYQLPTYPGDRFGIAYAVNDNGVAIGLSGPCGAGNSATVPEHALLWQNGRAIDLGNLGSQLNNNPEDINCRGDAVGFANIAGDATFHAFLWRKGVMTDLGTLPGDVHSIGEAINCQGQVVGRTSDADFNGVGYIWENGVMTDLNTLVPADSPLYITNATGINDLGQIVGTALTSTGDQHAFLATPIGKEAGEWPAARGTLPKPPFSMPEFPRKLRRPRGSLFLPR